MSGLAVGGYAGWQLLGTGIATRSAQADLRHDLGVDPSTTPTTPVRPDGTQPGTDRLGDARAVKAAPPAATPAGQPVALLRIPRLGATWSWVVVEGVDRADLAKGPGHYPGSAEPGQLGNFVVSGHRTTHGAPFWHAERLRRGDIIRVDTRSGAFEYRVSDTEVVAPDDVAVTAPVPHHPGSTPTRALLTITTCNPRFSARQRLIVHAQLSGVARR